jgi:NACalpha-BTF3-like transcription factor
MNFMAPKPAPAPTPITRNISTAAGPVMSPTRYTTGAGNPLDKQIKDMVLASIRKRQEEAEATRKELKGLQEKKEEPDLMQAIAQAAAILSGRPGRYAPLISSIFPKGMTPEKKQATIKNLQRILATTEEGITADQIALLKEKQKSLMGDPQREYKIGSKVLTYTGNVDRDLRELEKQGGSFEAANQLLDLSQKGNTVAFSALGTKMARAMGEVGVLTEYDVKRYVQSGMLTQKAGDKLRTMVQGKPTEATLEEIKNINTAMQDSFAKRQSRIIRKHAKRLSKNFNMSLEEAYERMGADMPLEEKVITEPGAYSASQEAGIKRVMEKNNVSREKAISALKKAGKL